MVFQKTWAGSNNVAVVYGPEDKTVPVINHLGTVKKADLFVQLKSLKGKVIEKKEFKNIELAEGHSISELDAFRFRNVPDGTYVISSELIEKN